MPEWNHSQISRAIKQFDLFSYLEEHNVTPQVRSERKFYYVTCLDCGKLKMFIHASSTDRYKGYWRCWACGIKGDIFDLVSRISQVSRREAFARVVGGSEEEYIQAGPILKIEFNGWDKEQKILINPPIDLPLNFSPILKLPKDHIGYRYARSRGLTDEMMKRFDVRYSSTMKRIVFPITHRGVTVGWQARTISTEGISKLLSSEGLKKSLVLYNFDAVQDKTYVTVVEGPIDAIKAGNFNSVALLGKSMSEHQYRLLLRLQHLRTIFLALDPDAYKQSMELAERLASIYTVRVVRLPQNKDIGDCTNDEIHHYLRISKFYSRQEIIL